MISLLKRLMHSQGEPPSVLPEAELNGYIDLAVKQFDSRLSAIPGYRKKLRGPVETALLYLQSLIQQIPGPIEVSKSAYGADPRVHAYFGSLDQIEHLFSHSRDFRDFSKMPASFELSHGYALMVMSRQEKRRPGHALNEDRLQREVMQDVVVFSEHSLAVPGMSDQNTRHELRTRKFKLLVAEAEKRVARQTERKADLQRQRIQLQIELKDRSAEQDSAAAPANGTTQSRATLTRQLEDTETAIDQASQTLKTINDYLDLLIEVLANPSECCVLRLQNDCLNRANVKVDRESGHEIPYAEMHFGELVHNLVIVRYPLSELVEQSSIANLVHTVYGN
ncbi:MAG: hypothetical protein KDI47_07465 [Gammaproteobacteria bacterium]|nr:hypothetical protein [Gammaproteobacteria bacterium]MCB1861554.1 hypothetical protein [Gammaproteobacteria bacterium]MCB1874014.1 hypothetical protein [Gammaproteobacteria bacterium]MCB1881974.1 hypothetical protein [Gammaproteobacteria bacterium]MCB1905197.1 hypothetical protein [Gammaproteobacteria bacterium]